MRHWLYPIGLHLFTAIALLSGAQWWIMGIVALTTFLWSVGWGWSCWLHKDEHPSVIQVLLDSAWISMVIIWLNIAVIRELGLGTATNLPWILWLLSLMWTFGGLWLSRTHQPVYPMAPRERKGLQFIGMAMLLLISWRSADIARPLDGYWYLEAASDNRHPLVPIRPANFWTNIENVGWIEAGAYAMTPTTPSPTLIADQRVNGRITLAVRGPIGSYIEANGERNEVAAQMVENPDEGLVDRYLEAGVAAISIWADLQPGEQIPLSVKGDRVYLMASSEAVWALHGTGKLRYTHYYQLLNQVENQRWAEEMLTTRRFTWNQPPGWSPILSLSNIFVTPDLNGAACLFLHVIALVAISSLRLATIIAPRAPTIAWMIPAGLMMAHGLLMLEPASQNFPDSLFAAALLGVWIGLVQKSSWRFATFGVLSQALRWPGAILATIFLLLYRWMSEGQSPWIQSLKNLWGLIIGGIIIAGLAMLTGDAEDLLFILYFETFPEHWHGNFNPWDLLMRIPDFFTKWILYTGGTILLSVPFLWSKHNRTIAPLGWSLLGYATLLGTIDHHPSHYFLPLVACTGPLFIASVTCLPNLMHQKILTGLGLFGIVVYLWFGIV